ncbi:hypothetical protein [Streptomyces shaanxiensis]|uniref:hypothetical protein n=1 Tax=Streptomyces shaanxiensis TaxID=653357 RepID=UPI0031F129F6
MESPADRAQQVHGVGQTLVGDSAQERLGRCQVALVEVARAEQEPGGLVTGPCQPSELLDGLPVVSGIEQFQGFA